MPTMTRTAEVKTRTTAHIKADAAAVYARWGISLSDAINIFLAKSIEFGGLPFDMRPETPTFDRLERYAYPPPWTQAESRNSRETGMTASEPAPAAWEIWHARFNFDDRDYKFRPVFVPQIRERRPGKEMHIRISSVRKITPPQGISSLKIILSGRNNEASRIE